SRAFRGVEIGIEQIDRGRPATSVETRDANRFGNRFSHHVHPPVGSALSCANGFDLVRSVRRLVNHRAASRTTSTASHLSTDATHKVQNRCYRALTSSLSLNCSW